MNNTIIAIINTIAQKLFPAYNNKILTTQYAWWMLEAVMSKSKTQLLSRDIQLTANQITTLNSWIEQQVVYHKPLAYILGSTPFLDLTILTEPPILIPRPETELLCVTLIELLQPFSHQPLSIVDMCSGSGCIALALAHAFPHFNVWGIDISEQAIALAQKNALYNKVPNVTFVQSDLFEKLPGKKFDLIIANPPYISFSEKSELEPSVIKWEDKNALFADDNGLFLIKKIITQAADHLTQQPLLCNNNIPLVWLEIGATQKNAVVEFMKTEQYSNIQVLKDLSGRARNVAGSPCGHYLT